MLSPGPGHPITDSGICEEVLNEFKGKLPIFGVCMGQQVMYHAFGGVVDYAGEIVHGKTSTITHDGKGFFKNVPQDISVTRYHSLSGQVSSLPDEFEITAKTQNGIIMGVRHKEYVIEGVQFHPESILTEEGHLMIKNLLSYSKGLWKEQEEFDKLKTASFANSAIQNVGNILEKIYAQRRIDYETIEKTPGYTFSDLQTLYQLGLAPKAESFYNRIVQCMKNNESAVISEIKRASPSKGDINLSINSVEQAKRYADAKVTAISVLTEPHWFKGCLNDLMNVRKFMDLNYEGSERPLLLRKEFIFNKYQILESRLAGADSILLIVKMFLSDLQTLEELCSFSRNLGMEPLVEVNSDEELKIATELLKAKVIGVNNRDLTTFKVDLSKSSSLVQLLPKDSSAVLLALSGIFNRETASKYASEGVRGFLVGEALMKAADPANLISDLKSA